MRTVVVMQVRTASTRLPGKALLPVAGLPSSVLAALRARNLNHEVRIATSSDPSDDELAEILRERGFKVVRGPMDDVLTRFVLAVADLPDECLVIRLTADNLVPDGHFITELETDFPASGVEYLYHSYPQSRVPYGVGADAFTVATLRKASSAATSPHDREHVVPWMIRNCRSAIHVPMELASIDRSNLRCTIDDENDYELVCRLFRGMQDPVRIGWFELTRRLSEVSGELFVHAPHGRFGTRAQEFVLGTVQLGMQYGIANRAGKPSRSTAIQIVRTAIAKGVRAIDTARAYGNAEEILGEAILHSRYPEIEVITKLDPLSSLAQDASATTVYSAVDDSVTRSCEALGVCQLPTLLLHRWQHYEQWSGAAWRRLLELRAQGKIVRLGVSVYGPEEALAALREPMIQHLQVPLNVIDWRWKSSGTDQALSERPEVIVHARSALLQGLLALPAKVWPLESSYDVSRCVVLLQEFVTKFDRENVVDLCIAYVRSQPWISGVVVGCDTSMQLEEDLKLFGYPRLTQEQCVELETSLPVAPEELLIPSKWKLVHEQPTH